MPSILKTSISSLLQASFEPYVNGGELIGSGIIGQSFIVHRDFRRGILPVMFAVSPNFKADILCQAGSGIRTLRIPGRCDVVDCSGRRNTLQVRSDLDQIRRSGWGKIVDYVNLAGLSHDFLAGEDLVALFSVRGIPVYSILYFVFHTLALSPRPSDPKSPPEISPSHFSFSDL